MMTLGRKEIRVNPVSARACPKISIDEFNKKRDVFYNQFTDKGHIEIAGNKMTIEEFESKPIEEQINDIMCF